MKANERAYRRMMAALKLRSSDLPQGSSPHDMVRAAMAQVGLELAIALDGTLEPRDRVAAVREVRMLTEKLLDVTPQKGGNSSDGANTGEIDDDDWDSPSSG